MSAAGPGRKNPTICHPAIAYKTLFGSVAGGQAAKEFAVKTNLLDFSAEVMRPCRRLGLGFFRSRASCR